MPREIVEIPVSREPLYEAVAVFGAVLVARFSQIEG
jgi:hypothetical protein